MDKQQRPEGYERVTEGRIQADDWLEWDDSGIKEFAMGMVDFPVPSINDRLKVWRKPPAKPVLRGSSHDQH